MQEKIRELAARIKELRELSGYTEGEMADYLSVPQKQYQGYESGKDDIPASVLFDISHRLGVDMSTLLTGEEPRMHVFAVTRKGKGVTVERRKQYNYETLADNYIHKNAEFFIVTVEPKPKEYVPTHHAHNGQEFNYVLEGTLKVYIHNNVIILNQGDSIYFDSSHGHAMEALGEKPAKFLAAIL